MIKRHRLVLDFGKRAAGFFAAEQLTHFSAKIGGDGHAMPTIPKGVVHPIDPADVGHQIKGEAKLPRPTVGDGNALELGKSSDHLRLQPLGTFVQVEVGAEIIAAAPEKTAVWREAKIVEEVFGVKKHPPFGA